MASVVISHPVKNGAWFDASCDIDWPSLLSNIASWVLMRPGVSSPPGCEPKKSHALSLRWHPLLTCIDIVFCGPQPQPETWQGQTATRRGEDDFSFSPQSPPDWFTLVVHPFPLLNPDWTLGLAEGTIIWGKGLFEENAPNFLGLLGLSPLRLPCPWW